MHQETLKADQSWTQILFGLAFLKVSQISRNQSPLCILCVISQSKGRVFLSPDTRSEGFLRGLKKFLEDLRGMNVFWKILRDMKFSKGSFKNNI